MCLPCAAPQCDICKFMMPVESMEACGPHAVYQCVNADTCFSNATNLGKRKRK